MMNYKTYKTSMGRKYRMRLCEDEKRDLFLLRALIALVPFGMCWLFAATAGMV